jgi:hypothetical protein
LVLKRQINVVLSRATGYELRKTHPAKHRRRGPLPGDRLLTAPTFVLCSVRSGSTLLRVLLDSHSQICAPQEMHLRDIAVGLETEYAARALRQVGMDPDRLRYLLWDRVLHRELEASGKPALVNKTPSDVFIADRILECWPDARFIFLLRHPAAIARSRVTGRPNDSPDRNVAVVRRYCEALEAARAAYPGLTVRYEELAADPAATTRRVCEFLGVPWEPEMLEYGRTDHGPYWAGLGDWSENIKSGRVQPPAPAPEDVPAPLHELAAAWGYAAPSAPAGAETASPPA